MQEYNFINLRLQIESLLHTHSKLRQENNSLRKKVAKLIQERATLLNTKEQACKTIKSILNQIKQETA